MEASISTTRTPSIGEEHTWRGIFEGTEGSAMYLIFRVDAILRIVCGVIAGTGRGRGFPYQHHEPKTFEITGIPVLEPPT